MPRLCDCASLSWMPSCTKLKRGASKWSTPQKNCRKGPSIFVLNETSFGAWLVSECMARRDSRLQVPSSAVLDVEEAATAIRAAPETSTVDVEAEPSLNSLEDYLQKAKSAGEARV